MTLHLIDIQPPSSPPSENPDPRLPVTPSREQETEPDVPEKPSLANEPELADKCGGPDTLRGS